MIERVQKEEEKKIAVISSTSPPSISLFGKLIDDLRKPPANRAKSIKNLILKYQDNNNNHQEVPNKRKNLQLQHEEKKVESQMGFSCTKLRVAGSNSKSLSNKLSASIVLIIYVITSTNFAQIHINANEQQSETISAAPSSADINGGDSSWTGTCFGGLQTFEKISMSSFENPAGFSSNSNNNPPSSGGILIQQDDQALTSECVNLCRSQSNCLSFVIDYNKFECKSYATTQQELQQEFEAKYQAARSVNGNNNNNANASTTTSEMFGNLNYSASTVNLQHLLPSVSSNYFEKICLDGVANRNQFADICGAGRLWTIERVVDSFLDGYVEKEITNVNNKDECSKLCIFETQFVCRSADFDQQTRLCRLSKEDRRTQPQAMRYVQNSNRQYIENQCATPGPSSCVYEQKRNLGIISMDALKFAQTNQDCQMKCNQETTFNCRSYSFHQQRCFLSGDDSASLNGQFIKLPVKQGWQFGEKKCLVELCTKGLFSYEKITGYTLRSALSTPIDLMMAGTSNMMPAYDEPYQSFEGIPSSTTTNLNDAKLSHLLPGQLDSRNRQSNITTADIVSSMMMAAINSPDRLVASGDLAESETNPHGRVQRQGRSGSNLAITNHCRHSCDLGYLNCPAFTIDYKNNRCQRLDRNSQGRHNELVARDGFSYYEKICLRVPEIMTMCQDKYWIFERVIGYELAPRFYDKSLKFVQSRRDCEEYCLEEKQFQCRSALYNDESSDCKLSRYDRRLASLEAGYYKNFNARISYLENQCIREHQTIDSSIDLDNKTSLHNKQIQCYYEQAREEPAYPTFTEHIEMVPASGSSNLEKQVDPYSSSIFNNKTYQTNKLGSSYCEQLCNENSKFECHSFGYYGSTAQCFLSGDDSISAGDMATTPSTGFTYFEKKCRFANINSNLPSPDSQANPNSESEDTKLSEPNKNQNPYFNQPKHHNNNSTQTNSNHPATEILNRPTSTTTTGSAFPTDANTHKCGLDHSFVYQRISGFEPIGGYLTLLVKNNETPGIVGECADLCKKAFECRAFVVDYDNNQCYAMLENSSIGTLRLRQTLGKDYFEGFCVADYVLTSGGGHSMNLNNCKNKTWIMDKIVDQAVIGVQAHKVLMDVDRVQCRQACLEERLFYCKSAMFDLSLGTCKLYSVDRESMAQMRLLFTKGVDFFENQCQIVTSSCPYDAIERDLTIVSVTKSTQARSTFDCEHSCNSETTFNCRSYTYQEQYPGLSNLCLLSSDSRSTSQKGSIKERPRALYAERNCFYRRPRYPAPSSNLHPEPPPEPVFDPLKQQHFSFGDPYKPPTSMGHRTPSIPPSGTTTVVGDELGVYDPTGRVVSTADKISGDFGLIPGQSCEPHQYTFERTFGYDYRLGMKERAPIAPTIGIAIGCQQECLRRGYQCQSFVVEYGLPYQSCFLIDTQVGANKKLLVKSQESAYFEKVCLPRTGVVIASYLAAQDHNILPEYSHQHVSYAPAPSSHHIHPLDNNMDISPSYTNEPWSPQMGANSSPSSSSASSTSLNMLPYYLQQQQLVQNYPSRSCAKLWSFERFPNHNFTIQSDKLVENILTKAQCETLCLNEASFNCRSATYDYANKLCRLFKNTRRTIMSQFVDLNNVNLSASASSSPPLKDPSSTSGNGSFTMGTAQVINNSNNNNNNDNNANEMHTAASNANSVSSANGQQLLLHGERQTGARQISSTTSGSAQTAEPSAQAPGNIDYLENTCTPEPSSCQYRQLYDLFNPYIDKITHATSLSDCQRQCDLERLFGCKSINYDPSSRNCMLINEDLISLNQRASSNGQTSTNGLLPKKNNIYSEKGNCEMISVQCNSQEMLVTINFDSAFRGRVMAKGNPEQCYMIGDGQTSLQFPIVFGPKCNTRQEGHNTFVNELIVQQHPVIMTDSDKTVRIMCAFEAPEQTITLKNPTSRDNKTMGIDVSGGAETSRTRHDKQQFNSIVSNKAAPPSVLLRILDQSGRDASMINLGDDLVLKIQMQTDSSGQHSGSALGLFARNLAAKSSNGESLLLIDNDGCPVDQQVFPALEIDPKDGKSLMSNFKAFRFPSSGLVNFEVQIRFCPERCQPVNCNLNQGIHQPLLRAKSHGRRRKRETEGARISVFESVNLDKSAALPSASNQRSPLEGLSTVMKPGKAFQYVRELMLSSSVGNVPVNNEPQILEASREDSIADTTTEFDQTTPTTEPSTSPAAIEETQPDGSSQSPIPGSDSVLPTELNQEFDPNGQTEASVQNMNAQSTNIESTNPNEQPQNGHQMSSVQISSSSLSPPILMHLDEKALMDNVQPESHLETSLKVKPMSLYHPVGSPPYGRLAPNNREDDGSRRNVLKPTLGSQMSNREMPLKFSILVGENQAANSVSSWAPSNGPTPSVLIMNSSRVDLDHIVVPGAGGMGINEDSPSNNGNDLNSDKNISPTTHSTNSNADMLASSSGSTPRDSIYNKKQAIFDALPSNSVASEVKLHGTRQTVEGAGYPSAEDKVVGSNGLSGSTVALDNSNSESQQSAASTAADAAAAAAISGHNDCNTHFPAANSHIGSGGGSGGRLWTIIWTGAFVIALNICLVLLSLVLYFRRVHWFNRSSNLTSTNSFACGSSANAAYRSSSSYLSDGGNVGYSPSSSSSSRWPSVLLKSKNNLSTSLNTHEHFFCKLNSKPNGSSPIPSPNHHHHNLNAVGNNGSSSLLTSSSSASSTSSSSFQLHTTNNTTTPTTITNSTQINNYKNKASNHSHSNPSTDFNWPNLSSSSNHSTISSMATGDHLLQHHNHNHNHYNRQQLPPSSSSATSIVRINQRQHLHKQPATFTDSLSIRSGKFNVAVYEPTDTNNTNFTCKVNSYDASNNNNHHHQEPLSSSSLSRATYTSNCDSLDTRRQADIFESMR